MCTPSSLLVPVVPPATFSRKLVQRQGPVAVGRPAWRQAAMPPSRAEALSNPICCSSSAARALVPSLGQAQ